MERLEAGRTVPCPCGYDARVQEAPPEAPFCVACCPWGHLLRLVDGQWQLEGAEPQRMGAPA